MDYPTYAQDARNAGDKRNMVYQRGMLIPQRIALDNASNLTELTHKGDVIYCDRNSTGNIGVKFDMSWPSAFPLAANGAIRGIPYEQLLLSWEAQAGKFVNLWFGYGVDIVAPNQDISSIGTVGSILSPVPVYEYGAEYAASFSSSAALAANTPVTIFTPAANVNGAILHSASFANRAGSTFSGSAFIARSSAPASPFSGDVLLQNERPHIGDLGGTNYYFNSNNLRHAVFIQPGLGLYFICGNAEDVSAKMALYTLL